MSAAMDVKQGFSHGSFYSLPEVERQGFGKISRLPVSLRIILESLLRSLDGKRVREPDIRALASWQPKAERTEEIPFVVSRVLLQDFTGVPLVVDLAAMRGAVKKAAKPPSLIEPLVPVDLVIDHSVQVDFAKVPNALQLNMRIEFTRNRARYEFLKWGMSAFHGLQIVRPGLGIVHQVNLEYLSPGVHERGGVYYPDSLVGTDSHTTMINGLGIVAYGVGGIEAEAGMRGQPVYFLTPEVVGVHMTGKLREGVTATDLVLHITEMLRAQKVVGKFVEFYGEGAASLPVPDRATIGNMAPEYGATMGFFAVDDKTVDYLINTGRTQQELDVFEAYFRAQGLFGMPAAGAIDYSQTLELDLASVVPSLAGPKRPQDRIPLPKMKESFNTLFSKPTAENGFNQPADKLTRRFPTKLYSSAPAQTNDNAQQLHGAKKPLDVVEMVDNRPTQDRVAVTGPKPVDIGNGDVLIAAITSCTNTSNPGVLLAAGLLAKKAAAKGLTVKPYIKTSLAPGSRVVTDYLTKSGLLPELEKLNFYLAGYGCTTCIGNSGPLDPAIEETITQNDLVCAAVLSGNRNFEARIHPNIRANFLASPPLVVAYAIAGRANIDLSTEPLGTGRDGKDVYLRDVWPTSEEIGAVMQYATDPATYRRLYGDFTKENPLWNAIPTSTGQVYPWDKSTYIAEPPFFAGFSMQPSPMPAVRGARALGIFGDSVTTDHISPAGSIKPTSPAGIYLLEHDVGVPDFNRYGSRRGNHEVMMRGTFANVRIKNLMLPVKEGGSRVEGGFTLLHPEGKQMPIYDAAMTYIARGMPTIVFAGEEYGTGSSRDWAAKGTQLLGVKAVIAKSFERIHRSNLVGMGVLPCQFKGTDSVTSLAIDGTEEFDITGLEAGIKPQMDVTLVIRRKNGASKQVPVLLRIDTPIEVDYYHHGGILPFVLLQLLAA